MKVVILYHPKSEQERPVTEFVREFHARTGRVIYLQSLETVKGARTAELYDIVRYPAILIIREDGQLVRMWEGQALPLIDEVEAYSHTDD